MNRRNKFFSGFLLSKYQTYLLTKYAENKINAYRKLGE